MFALQILHNLCLPAVHNFWTGLSFISQKEWCINRHTLQEEFYYSREWACAVLSVVLLQQCILSTEMFN